MLSHVHFWRLCTSFEGCILLSTAIYYVSYEGQVKNFFISKKSCVPFSGYSSFCMFNHSIIYQICDVMMSISIWDRVHFRIYLLNHNSLSHQTWPIDRYKEGESFSGIFWTGIWRIGAKVQVLFNLATCSNYSITHYVTILVFTFFEKVNKEHVKMVSVNYQKWPDLTMMSF